MTTSTMPNDEVLLSIAFHSEKVKSNRLAKKMSLSAENALRQILLQTIEKSQNNLSTLSQLVTQRQTLLEKKAAALALQHAKSTQSHLEKIQRKSIPNNAWCLWFDGSAKPNPGKCSIGVVLQAPNGQQTNMSQQIADGDSSYAEYQALITGLLMVIKMNQTMRAQDKIQRLYVIGDSQVVLNDVQSNTSTGLAQNTKNSTKKSSVILTPYRLHAQSLIKQLNDVVFMWKPRHNNAQADTLSQNAFRTFENNE